MNPDPQQLLDVALEAARTGGRVLLERADRHREIGFKSTDTDLVTDADRASEAAITALLRERFPDHALMAEEGTWTAGEAGEEGAGGKGAAGEGGAARPASAAPLKWVVDPLDGTVNYAHGIPHWCVSVAVEDERGPVAGVVYDPLRDETFAAARGRGATLNGRPMSVTDTSDLRQGIFATGFAYGQENRTRNTPLFAAFLQRARGMRRMGSAALDLAWVACGRFDGFWELGLSRWDIAAGGLLVAEAGGRVSGFASDEPWLDTGRVVAANPALQPKMLRVIEAAGGR